MRRLSSLDVPGETVDGSASKRGLGATFDMRRGKGFDVRMSRVRLDYVADPMCSWCYGFAPVLAAVRRRLADHVDLHYVLGGLAPDDDEPMAAETRRYVQAAWDAVERTTGATFNRDFWKVATPRRSTYPACRAVLAAQAQGADAADMFAAIQKAYYREARNPSEPSVLNELAGELGLDVGRFRSDLASVAIESALQDHLARARALRVTGFPSLAVTRDDEHEVVMRGYEPAAALLPKLARLELLGN